MNKIPLIPAVFLSLISVSVWSAPRDPIVISGDGDFTSENGVTGGTGTELDPYTISGWDITTGDTCITLSNTTSYFVVSDNSCFNPQIIPSTIRTGFSFTDVSNGTVSSNDINSLYGETGDSAGEDGGNIYGIVLEDVTNFVIDDENTLTNFLGGVGFLGGTGAAGGSGGTAYGIHVSGTNSDLTIDNNTFGTLLEGLLGGTGGAGGPGGPTGGAGGMGGNTISIYITGQITNTYISNNSFEGSFGGNGGAGALGDLNGNGGDGGNGGQQVTVFVDAGISTLEITQNEFGDLQAATGGLGAAGSSSGGDGGAGGNGGNMIAVLVDGRDEVASNVIVANNTVDGILAGTGALGNFGIQGTVGGDGGDGGNGGSAYGVLVYGISASQVNGNNLSNVLAGGGGAPGIGAVGVTQGGNGGSGGISGKAYGIFGGELTSTTVNSNTIDTVTAGSGAVGATGALATAGTGGDGGNGASGGTSMGIYVENSPTVNINSNDITLLTAGQGGIGALAGTGVIGFGSGGNGGNGGDSGSATGIRISFSDDAFIQNNTFDSVDAGSLAGIGNDAGAPLLGNTGGDGGDGGDGTGIYLSNSANPTLSGNMFGSITAGSGNAGGVPGGEHGTDGFANTVVDENAGFLRFAPCPRKRIKCRRLR